MKSLLKRYVRESRGAAAVEFAILTPVFLLMLTGMIAYGIYFGAALSLQQLTADAARTAIAGVNDTERNFLVKRFLDKNARSYMLIDPHDLTPSYADSSTDPNQYVVRLSYNAAALPIWNLYLPLPLPSKTITHEATIRRGGI